jgi:hypothetical protein
MQPKITAFQLNSATSWSAGMKGWCGGIGAGSEGGTEWAKADLLDLKENLPSPIRKLKHRPGLARYSGSRTVP